MVGGFEFEGLPSRYGDVMTTTDEVRPVPKQPRLAEFDVVRALVLVGVFTMNYIVYWRVERMRGGWRAGDVPGWLTSLFDPWSGPLSTRFAATLSTLVGFGVAMGARPSLSTGNCEAIARHRWVLRRRGVLFILIGVMFDAVWSGEILHYVGAYLVIVSWMITWRTSRQVIAAVCVVLITVVQRVAVFVVVDDGIVFSWWNGANERTLGRVPVGTPQGYLSSILSWGGHPVLPWLAFVIAGMVLARVLVPVGAIGVTTRSRLLTIGFGFGCIATSIAFAAIMNAVVSDRWRWVASFDPVSLRGKPYGLAMPAYVLSTIGSSVIAITVISWVAKKFAHALPTRVLARAGRMTFTLYVLHGLTPWFLTTRHIVGRGFTFYGSLGIAVGSWAVAVVVAAFYQRWRKIGPLEWLLRKIGG